MFLYSTVSSPLDRSKHFTPHPPPPRQTCSFRHPLDFSGKYSAMQQLLHGDYPLTFPPLSKARCSFIQLSELGRCGENENAKALKQQQRGVEPGLSRLRVRHSTAELPSSTKHFTPSQFFSTMAIDQLHFEHKQMFSANDL